MKPVSVYFTDPVPGACLVGVFKPYIVLPLITAPQDVKNVLTHEVCHLKNKDHLWGVLRLFCCAIHWFNPLVWIAASMSRTDSELRCDDRVTGPMNESERKEYANVLVLAAARKSMPGLGVMATGMTMTGKRLKNRLLTVLADRQTKRWLTISFAVLASSAHLSSAARPASAGLAVVYLCYLYCLYCPCCLCSVGSADFVAAVSADACREPDYSASRRQ